MGWLWSVARASPLRQPLIEGTTVRNLSPTTQASHIDAVQKLSLLSRRSPVDLGILVDRLDLIPAKRKLPVRF